MTEEKQYCENIASSNDRSEQSRACMHEQCVSTETDLTELRLIAFYVCCFCGTD